MDIKLKAIGKKTKSEMQEEKASTVFSYDFSDPNGGDVNFICAGCHEVLYTSMNKSYVVGRALVCPCGTINTLPDEDVVP